jgi:DNA-binding response OmpR family regulator
MIRVLIVDDDKDFLKIVSAILDSAGYLVTTAQDAHDALEKIQQETFDVILSDANMPGPSGFDLVKTIRSHSKLSGIAIALLTGRRDHRDIERGLSSGADDYLVKPIDADLFLAKVNSLLVKRPQADVPEVSFAESRVQMDATFEATLKILKISEQGLSVLGATAIANNHKFKIKSNLFEIIGIEPPMLRSLSSKPAIEQPGFFLTTLSFVGLPDRELQKIRFWINMTFSKKAV